VNVKVRFNEGYRELVKEAMLATMNITQLSQPELYEQRMSIPLSDKVFRMMLIGTHSPVKRCKIYIEAVIPNRVMTHITRHHDTLHYVGTSRPDIRYGKETPDGMRIVSMEYDAKRLIEICKLRLCGMAWKETIELFEEIKRQVLELEPCFDGFLNPSCVWLGGVCPERGFGFNKTDEFVWARDEFEDWRDM